MEYESKVIHSLNQIKNLKRFPNNTNLRIGYAFFLMERMKYKQQALHELTNSEKNKPSFDIEFIIFRYK